MSGLGRLAPSDWSHVESYPLSALPTSLVPTGVPVTIGINWYSNFDNPVQRGTRWYIGEGPLGSIRGGHCVCLRPSGLTDITGWWDFYNQGAEGACVGFGSSRMMTLLNRRRYNPWWLWDESKIQDEWPDTNPGDSSGTSVHAAMTILRTVGHVAWRSTMQWPGSVRVRDAYPAQPLEGIETVRWATTTDEVLAVLGLSPTATHVRLLNSWGRDYPHVVQLPVSVLDRLIREDGEVALVTDR